MKKLPSFSGEEPITSHHQAPHSYVKWRLMVIQTQLYQIKDKRNSTKVTFLDEQELLEEEQILLLGQGKFIEEDLKDSITKAGGVYIDQLSSHAMQYLGAERVVDTQTERFCSVLGTWIIKCYANCVRVVPKSFETKNLAYVFGANDAGLTSVHNGIIIVRTFEDAFDKGWVSIVPDDSVEATPTRWKVVVLNDAIMKNIVYTTKERIWSFEDLHNRQLTWQNDNRPARRHLYFRYVMVIMHAQYQGWVGYRDRIPPGKVWASPKKPEGYLRKSVLRSLARIVHDEDVLPEELIEAGGFDDTDPPTGTDTVDRMAALELGLVMRRECRKKSAGPDLEISDWEESESN